MATIAGVVFVVGAFWLRVGDFTQENESRRPAVSLPYPEVVCGVRACQVRVALDVDGQVIRSGSLPFSASSPEISEIPVDTGFGLGDIHGRTLSAWAVGKEEHAILLALEPIGTGVGTGIIAHQTAGFDHPKRAHVVLVPKDGRMVVSLKVVEGVGLESIELWPVAGGVMVARRSAGAAAGSLQRYRWQVIDGALSLELIESH